MDPPLFQILNRQYAPVAAEKGKKEPIFGIEESIPTKYRKLIPPSTKAYDNWIFSLLSWTLR